MELPATQELIKKLREAKDKNEYTYPRLEEMLRQIKKPISRSTLIRIFGSDPDENFSYSYEGTLLPLAQVLLNSEDMPVPDDSPYADEINNLKILIRSQSEEIDRLREMKEHLEERITFLLEQIEKKDRRMDEKEETIQKLMNKYVLKE